VTFGFESSVKLQGDSRLAPFASAPMHLAAAFLNAAMIIALPREQ